MTAGTEHRFELREEGPPHEHDTWVCDCGAWWYQGGCAVCGEAPDPEAIDVHCGIFCYAIEGVPCVAEESRSLWLAQQADQG